MTENLRASASAGTGAMAPTAADVGSCTEEVRNLYPGAVNYANGLQLLLASGAYPAREGLAMPVQTLMGLAIELCLEAVILHRGGDPKKLKDVNVRHNLCALAAEARGLGFALKTRNIDRIITKISDNYGSHEYRYLKEGGRLKYMHGTDVSPSVQSLVHEVAVDVGLPIRPDAVKR